jgi:hypothetical protein
MRRFFGLWQGSKAATRVARQLSGLGGVDMTPLDTLDDLVYGYAGILVALGGTALYNL